MRVLLLALVGWCLLWAPAFAQTHGCDGTAPPSSTTTEAGSVPLGWCHPGLDVKGNPTPITSWALYANNVRTPLTNVITDGVPNAAGLVWYEATVTFAQGNYTLYVVGINGAGEAPRGDPFALVVSGPSAVPAAVTRLQVQPS